MPEREREEMCLFVIDCVKKNKFELKRLNRKNSLKSSKVVPHQLLFSCFYWMSFDDVDD